MPKQAAVPAALTLDWVAGKYLNFAGGNALGPPVAPARTGRHGAACRVVVGRGIERRIGTLVTTLADIVGSSGELAAPIVFKHDREDREVWMEAIMRAAHDGWRTKTTFAAAETSRLAGDELVVKTTRRTLVHANTPRRKAECVSPNLSDSPHVRADAHRGHMPLTH